MPLSAGLPSPHPLITTEHQGRGGDRVSAGTQGPGSDRGCRAQSPGRSRMAPSSPTGLRVPPSAPSPSLSSWVPFLSRAASSSPTLSQGHGLPSVSTRPARAEMLRTRHPCTKQHHFLFKSRPPSPPPPTCVEDTSNFPVIQTRTLSHLPNTHPLLIESGVDPDHFTSHTGVH